MKPTHYSIFVQQLVLLSRILKTEITTMLDFVSEFNSVLYCYLILYNTAAGKPL